MKLRIGLGVIASLALLFVASYCWFRATHTERWEEDGRVYVVFPEGKPVIYYTYRPLSYLDGAVTGIRFHIGPHR